MPSIDVLAPPPPPPPPPPAPEVQQETDTTPSTQPIVGIIYPPPEVRNIVDKTASFVARNGPEFEARIRQNEIGNPKFNFLNFGDPYHAYYQHKVKDFREGRGQEPSGPPTAPKASALAPSQQQKQQEILKQISEQPFIPKDPPPEFEFIADPPSISALDLDIVKLTAQFVARNGRQFLTNLMNREQRNYQFDFLRPQHSLFQYFTKLLEQYTKVLIPPKELMFKLKEESSSMNVILDMVKYRAEWIKYQEAQRRKEEEELEKERVAYAQIDWHDFVVVETVDYQPFEVGNFPPPTTPDEVGARVLMQERIEEGEDMEMQIESEGEGEGEDGKRDDDDDDDDEDERESEEEEQTERERDRERGRERERQREDDDSEAKEAKDDTQVRDMEEDSSDEEESATPAPQKKPPPPPPSMPPPAPGKEPVQQPPPLPPIPDKVIVKKGYDPKQAVKATRPPAPDEVLISPITGEKIPASKVQEHMRIGLLDPRWVEQRDRQIQDKLNQETVYAPGSAIEASLKQLAERRTDIFGVGDEETAIGKKIGEEDKKKEEKVTWDGHTSSVEAATRAARANITLEEQIHQIHKVKGLLPDEEKEKIGPKPVAAGRSGSTQQQVQQQQQQQQQQPPAPPGPPPGMRSGPQNPPIPGVPMGKQPPVTTSAPPPPKPPPPVPPVQPPPPPPRPAVPPVPPMAPVPPPPGLLAPQPGMMMVPMSRPPIMVPARPPFPVAAPAPPMPGFMPPAPQMPPPPQGPQVGTKHPSDGPSEDEPAAKKSNVRTEESLLPEDLFLAQHKSKGPVTFKVAVPNLTDKPEWRLRGQVLNLTLPLTDTVAVVKAKVHEETGMPPGKQKLHWEGLFFKDSNSLAYYNIMPGTIIGLQLKERGGRRK
ncbi:splicing factor 3A subunit 1 isoform X2 [Schistocerca gregaria]|uniref:splicing factor 3A subunit 1 isoform X2 n=1 Tax=Schistocerca gregaria TaxID=7010 RepID=UPI00211E62B1|nr:splicing factor 3A subunit 1 isoform X2 [Schistocerca gregaria]